jgi:hypothetical protein
VLDIVELVDLLRELEADLGVELRWKLEAVKLRREAEGELGAELRGELEIELGTELRGELEVELGADLSEVLAVELEVGSRELRLATEGSTVSTQRFFDHTSTRDEEPDEELGKEALSKNVVFMLLSATMRPAFARVTRCDDSSRLRSSLLTALD